MLNNKKAEIGESITWVVATIIILVVLIIFIYAANVLGGFQSFKVSSGERILDSDNHLKIKTEAAFREVSSNKEKINNWIEINPLEKKNE